MTQGCDLLDRFVDAVLDLDAFADAVLAGGVEESLHRRQRAEAFGILATCTPATHRAVVAWAAGVMEASHAAHFIQPVTAQSFAVEMSGGSLDGGRRYNANRKGLEVTVGFGETGAKVTWQYVAAMFGPDTIPAALGAEISEAMAERRRRTVDWVPGSSMRAATEQHDAWSEIEWRCYDLGARVWELARPAGIRRAGAPGTPHG